METGNAKQVLSNLYGLMMEINLHRADEDILDELKNNPDPQIEKHLTNIRRLTTKYKAYAYKLQFQKVPIMSISLILLIVLILILVGALPSWGHSRSWGYGPSGGIGLVVLILIVLLLMGKI